MKNGIYWQFCHFLRLSTYFFWKNSPGWIKERIRSNPLAKKVWLAIFPSVMPVSTFELVQIQKDPKPQVNTLDIVITSYKQSEYLISALQSIICQSFQPNRVVIVNHCDDPIELAELQRVIDIFSQIDIKLLDVEECWPGTARNYGSRECNSDAILFLDCDDYLHPEYLGNGMLWMNVLDCDFVGAWCQTFTEHEGRKQFGDVWRVIKAPTWENLVTSNTFPVSSIIRRAAFDSIGGWNDLDSQNIRQDEAINLWRRLVIKGFFGVNIQQPFIYLRRHSRNLSSKASEIELFKDSKMRDSWNSLLTIEGRERKLSANSAITINSNGLRFLNDAHLPANQKENILFLLPDATFFGAGKVIAWTFLELAKTKNIILVNCDIKGLAGELSEILNHIDRKQIVELGAMLSPSDWDLFISELIEQFEIVDVISFGHILVNNVLLELMNKHGSTQFTNWMFNTQSENATWLAQKPNSYAKLFVESDVSLQFLTKSGWEIDRIKLVRHLAHRIGLDVSTIQKWESSTDVLKVLWFSRMASEKQPEEFLRLAGNLAGDRDLRLIMGGEGPLRSEMEQLAKRVANVFFLDENAEGIVEMSEADFFISTSSSIEGRPLVIIEALEMGLNVLAPSSGAIREFVLDGYLGITIYNNLDELTQLLRGVAKIPTKFDKRSIGEHNRKISSERMIPFSIN
jgi:glycosyltransferase involved in cell wall biosynthesis